MDRAANPSSLDPLVAAYKKDIDRTLILENLKLTHEQRLQNLVSLQKFTGELRAAGENMRRVRF